MELISCQLFTLLSLFCLYFTESFAEDEVLDLKCYKDSTTRRVVGHYFRDENLTTQQCIQECRSRGYLYAALEVGLECFCGNDQAALTEYAKETDCNFYCLGERNKRCGGNWRFNLFSIRASCEKVEVSDDTPIYVGCFKDQYERKLVGHYFSNEENLTPEKCIKECQQKGFLYAGLQMGHECFCGNQQKILSERVDETECNQACKGNTSTKCGGEWRINLYSVGKCVQGGSDHMYLGCFKDNAEKKLSGHHFRDVEMTPKKCAEVCKEKNYVYAGLQVGVECFCGNQRTAIEEKVLDEECNFPCAGDNSKKCGSNWRSTVYSTSNVEKRSYRGCYKDDASRKLSGQYFIINLPLDGMTPAKCLYLCGQYRFMYVGLQVGVECYCGNQQLIEADKAPESECNYGCTGDYAKKCGGNWRNTIYSTGFTIEEVEKPYKSLKYVGCYMDDNNRKLDGYYFKSETMLPEKCVETCSKFGFLYAGLQVGSECYCGDRSPEAKEKMNDEDCKSFVCFGDYGRACGGRWRNSLYSTNVDTKGVITSTDPNYTYKGCFKPGPLLVEDYEEDFGFSLTTDLCVKLCKRYDKPYAAISSGTVCKCISEVPYPENKISDNICNTKCPGDTSKYCGGMKGNAIYETGISELAKEDFSKKYVGCFNINYDPFSYNKIYHYTNSNMSVGVCITVCKFYGYFYASVSNGDQCYCGDKQIQTKQKISDIDCNIPCSKDSRYMCGGNQKQSVYRTGKVGEEPKVADFGVKHVGCFNEKIKLKELRSFIVDYGNQLGPKKCVEKCSQLGFKYTGLLAGSTCLCGNQEPTAGFILSNNECSARCTGENESTCGGLETITVYKTTIQDVDGEIDIRSRYLGCYKDQGNPRSLIGSYKQMDYLTPWECVKECKKKNYLYAGLQAGSECHCGDQHPKLSQRLRELDCSFTCFGDKLRFCGGTWANTIYHTSSTGSEAKIAEIGYRYLGCYIDQENPRQLSSHQSYFPDTMTPILCVRLCKDYGYFYAGLQYGENCFCGDTHPIPLDLVDDSECNSKCTGDVTKLCGGNRKNIVHFTGNHDYAFIEKTGLKYLGCYKDEESQRRIKGYSENFKEELSPMKCVTLCKSRGYIYAALQNGSLCLCGDQYPSPSDKVNNTQCDSRCVGNTAKICGGVLKNLIYHTGFAGTAVADVGYQYLGCFTVTNPIQLSGKSKDFNNLMTPESCVTFCKEAGHLYAGLHYGSHCYCGDSSPSVADKVIEGDCSSKCLGDFSKICGGPNTFTAYVTTEAVSGDNKGTNNNSDKKRCVSSETTVNEGRTCSGSIVFEETFTQALSIKKWKHHVEIADPEDSFSIFSSDSANSYTANNKLIIKPSLLPEHIVKHGVIDLPGCTAKEKKNCMKRAASYLIVPPVQSARLTTKDYFSFKYGKVEIRAKLPIGDWIVPELWLEPKEQFYGPGIISGRIKIALSRGNRDLTDDRNDLSCHHLENGVTVGVGDLIKEKKVTKESVSCWQEDFHNYTLIWTPEKMIFYIDGEESAPIQPEENKKLTNHLGFNKDYLSLWRFGSNLAPFDKEFYIHIGLSVGGNSFPDGAMSNGRSKPWRHKELRSLLNFWLSLKYWEPTWIGGSTLEIDSIKVTTL